MTIYIEKLPYTSFISPRRLDSFQIAAIIFLIAHSTSARANYIYLDKLHFLFDMLICDQDFSNFPKFTIPPWNIDKELKNKVIILVRNDIISQSYDGNKVRYSLTEKGLSKFNEFIEVEELSTLSAKAKVLASTTKKTFERSKVIYNV
jgi:predicted transcriptional regulator